jgi:thiamine-monophosphate kinase
LLHPDQGLELTECDRQALIQKHQRPVPRLDLIPILNQLVTDSEDWTRFPIAGMDSSDGLADAVLQICQASGVGAELDRAQIPMPSEILNWVSPQQAIEWALYGGEDFELVLCLPLSLAERFIESALHESVSHHIVVIGEITRDRTVTLIDSQGHFPPEVLTLERGFQHF